ncbi:MAG TPA: YpjP family protein [Virgibacillus sp.]|nr:YpjP family protein [Virgibacillus sp.]
MKRWMKKIAVAFVAVMTLGLYIPPIHMDVEAEGEKEALRNADLPDESQVNESMEPGSDESGDADRNEVTVDEPDYVQLLTDKAIEQTMAKLGPRISEQVEDEFMESILPAMESVLESVLSEAGEDVLPYYAITEKPAKGTGERIFHVYDFHSKKDVARFDVRRDNRPQDGYWFNFHYHLSSDNFESHHEIGEIYWNKNVPPQWMS